MINIAMHDSLPLLLALIRKNVLLQSLLFTGHLPQEGLANLKFDSLNAFVRIENFALSKEDVFTMEYIELPEESGAKCANKYLTFYTAEAMYFENADLYLNDNPDGERNLHPLVNIWKCC
jgi:uncharacterized protein YneR